jgi:hypothetical protein
MPPNYDAQLALHIPSMVPTSVFRQVLRREFQKRIYSPRSKEAIPVVEEAIRDGQLPVGTDVNNFLDAIVGPLFIRLVLRHQRIHESFVVSVFDRVVEGTRAMAKTVLNAE